MKLKSIVKYLFIFMVGYCTYYGVEILYRGHSSWTMGILGGLMLVLVGGINNWIPHGTGFIKQMAIGAVMITVAEFIAGLILNVWLGLHIWDYSNLPLNIMGQISLPFTVAWFFLSGIAILLDDWIRWRFFGEMKPEYKLWG